MFKTAVWIGVLAAERPLRLDLGGAKPTSCCIVDADLTWEEVPVPDILPPRSFIVLSF